MPENMDPYDWIISGDTGISSEAIWCVMMGATPSRRAHHNIPRDPSDFGRCHRLLERIPEWRERMGEVPRVFPMWGPLVAAWDELTELYVAYLTAERKHGRGPPYPSSQRHTRLRKAYEEHPTNVAYRRMYDRMKSLEDECYIAGGWERTGAGSWRRCSTTVVRLAGGDDA